MKTVVVGVFDQLTDAGRVIAQLAASPLDMDTVQVVHAQAGVQERLSAEAGLPPRRAALSTLLAGAALGALAGFWMGGGFVGADASADASAGSAAILPGLGPLPGLALGLVLGAALGLLAALFGERTEIPEEHREGLLQALQEGATVLTVRTENLPTARAIGDLFRAGGSRLLEGPAAQAAPGAPPPALRAAEAGSPTADAPANPPPSHAAFVPPWRRAGGGEERPEAPFTLFPEAEAGAAGVDAPTTAVADSAHAAAAAVEPSASQPRRALRHGDVVTGPDTSSRPLQVTQVTPLPSGIAPAFVARSPGDRAGAADAASETSLEALGLPARVVRALQAEQVRDTATLRRLAAEDPRALDLIPGIGPMAQKQIRAALGLPQADAAPDA